MQNTIIKEFEGNPNVVTAVFQEGGRQNETYDWARTFWSNYYLRGTVIWDQSGSVGQANYLHPRTGLPFGRGFIIDQNGDVALPTFGHNPKLVTQTIYSLLPFVRGDISGNNEVEISDVVKLLHHISGRSEALTHPDSHDANSDNVVDIADAVYLVNHLFRDGPPPANPFPNPGDNSTP